jgi:membrane protein implicated in regulation of membrane protease activity
LLDFMMAPENLPFAVALLLMLMIGAVEALGLGVGAAGVDADVDADTDLLGWLGLGRIPLLMLIVVLLALFGLVGIAGQQVAAALFGAPLSPWIAGPAAFLASLPLAGVAARGLEKVLPRDETTAVSLEELVGRRATIVVGTARQGSPARASVRDRHGLTHYVMAEPTDGQGVGEGGTLLLVRREGEIFVGLPEGQDLFASAAAPGPPALLR